MATPKRFAIFVTAALFLLAPAITLAQGPGRPDIAPPEACSALPNHTNLTAALDAVVNGAPRGGLDNDMWATVVNRDGIVCAVAFSGADRGQQWPGSRVISAQKANTANAFSLPSGAGGALPGLSLSTANLFSAVQPGASLFGLQFSNPVDTDVAYQGPSARFGQQNDPMRLRTIGGVNVFGGGLALYASGGDLVGGLGVSGDTSCTDHITAWRVRDMLGLDNVPTGVSPAGDDNIIHDIDADGVSASGFGHPECDPAATGIAADLPNSSPIGP